MIRFYDMKLRIAAALVCAIVGLGLSAKEKCKVIITASEGALPYELVVAPSSEDPKDSPLRTTLEAGPYECEIETDQIEQYEVVDLGEMFATGRTSRTVDFFIEDGATIKVNFDGEKLTVESDGAEFQRKRQMEKDLDEYAQRLHEEAGTDDLTEEQKAALMAKYNQFQLDYYATNPMISFLLDLSNRISHYHFTMNSLPKQLDVYHKYYEDLFPGHKAHEIIAQGEKAGYQILGWPYCDYEAYDADGQTVKASDYYAGKPTVVILWATWCAPCRAEAIEMIPIYEKYRERGLNFFSVAREFGSPDKFKEMVAKDKYPWPCLYDLDNKFGIFDSHGTASSGLYLIDADGTIIASGYDWADLEAAADSILPPEL